jgi:hypothetical protein
VLLRAPPPLDRELEVEEAGDTASLKDGDTLIALATRAEVDVDVPPPPSLERASAAEQRFTGLTDHSFPGCFVCGPERGEGDGLRIFPGPIGDAAKQVAGAWTPDDSLAGQDGGLSPEFIWAALDCPGYFAVADAAGTAVLGRFAVRIFEPRIAPQPLIVTGWPIASDGRKHQAGTALHDAHGHLLAAAHATWVTLKDQGAA